MKDKMLQWLRHWPAFVWLLPVFFVLHGCMENFNYIPFSDAALLTGLYIAVTLLLLLIGRLVFRSWAKASFFAFLVMAFHFFFGSMHDALRKIAGNSFISTYTFVLPAALLFFIVAFIFIKRKKTGFGRLFLYLNALFLVLLLTDAVMLLGKMQRQHRVAALPASFANCDTCSKPDIYFILADEYAGNEELKNLFGYDDSAFIQSLEQRQFKVLKESYSNYNYTPFSMASILNMNYLSLGGKNRDQSDLTYCYESIRNSSVLQFLQSQQYQFYNYSIFDFEGQPGRRLENFLPVSTRLITAQTFLSRIDKEILFNIVTRWRSNAGRKKVTYAAKHNNENIYDLTWKIAEQKTTAPKFVYAHLEMPHYPYYYDKNGQEQPFDKLTEGNQVNKAAYIGYLQYCNGKLAALVDHILQSSARPPVIILMGDHGFRHFNEPVDNKYYFMNLVSVHLPNRDYSSFHDSLTGVNLFRALFNSSFGQHLPYLKDSTSYLKD